MPLSPAGGRWVGETVRVYTEPLEMEEESVFSPVCALWVGGDVMNSCIVIIL